SPAGAAAFGAPRNRIVGRQDVTDLRSPLHHTDKFGLQVYQDSGSSLNVVPGYPDGSYILATYVGERQEDIIVEHVVEFDSIGVGANTSNTSTITWNHIASGTNRAVIVYLYMVYPR